LAGGVPRQGVVVEGVKEDKKAPSRPKYTKTAPKTGSFLHFLVSKIAEKDSFFALSKIYFQYVF
jgi:hypothetical protein